MINCTVGELRQRITFQTETRSTDAAGERVASGSYVDVASVWARIKTLQSREAKRGEKVELQSTHQLTIRYRAGITSKMSIKFGTRRFQITGIVNVDEKNIQLDINCAETTGD